MVRQWPWSRRGDEGFTLVELLIVIAIIGVLAAVAIPVFLSQTDKAENAAVESDLNSAYKMVLTAATVDPDVLPLAPIEAGVNTPIGDIGSINPGHDLFFYGSTVTDLCVGSYTPAFDLFSGKKSGVTDVYCGGGALTDSDNDGVSDLDELLASSDPSDNTATAGAGGDSDSDGFSDAAENYFGTNPADNTDYPADATPGSGGSGGGSGGGPLDSDGDNISDDDEVNLYGTDPNLADTDGDTLNDDAEIYGSPSTNPLLADTDGDGYNDNAEIYYYFTDPNVADTPADSDGDNLFDVDELAGVGGYVTDPNLADTDGDTLNDDAEIYSHGTSPLLADTDGDSHGDAEEIYWYFTDPLQATSVPVDTDADDISDGTEINFYFTNPNNADTDGDGYNDGAEVWVHFTDPNDAGSHP